MLLASYLVVVTERGACPFLCETRAMCQTARSRPVISTLNGHCGQSEINVHRQSVASVQIRQTPRQQMVRRIADLNFSNPFAVFPNRFQRGQVAAVAEGPRGGAQSTPLQIISGV